MGTPINLSALQIPVQTPTGSLNAALTSNAKTGQTVAVVVDGARVYVHPEQAKQINAQAAKGHPSHLPSVKPRPASLVYRADLSALYGGSQVDATLVQTAARKQGSPTLANLFSQLPTAQQHDMAAQVLSNEVVAGEK